MLLNLQKLTILVLLFVVAFVNGSALTKPKEKPKTCSAMVSGLVKSQMKTISKCIKTLKFKTPREKKDRSNCVMKCVFMDQGILNDEGYADVVLVAEFLLNEVPDFMLGKMLKLMAECKDLAEGSLDPDEFSCKSYEPLIKCVANALPTICTGIK